MVELHSWWCQVRHEHYFLPDSGLVVLWTQRRGGA